MNSIHTVILGTTTVGISTATQRNLDSAHRRRFLMELYRRQNRFSEASTSSTTRIAYEINHRSNGSSQVTRKGRSFGRRLNVSVVATHQIRVGSCQVSTIVLIGSAFGQHPPLYNLNVRSVST